MTLLPCLAPLLLGSQDLLPAQERGLPSTRPPQPVEVRIPDRCLHDDEVGGCDQHLLAGASAPQGGFVLAWRDLREAHAGLYLRRFDADGAPLGADGPVHGHRTTRMSAPALALARDGSGVLAWVFPVGQRYEVHARLWGADGEWVRPSFGLESRQAGARADRPGRPDEFAVAVAVGPEGGVLVAWRDRDQIKAQRFDRRARALSRIEVLSDRRSAARRALRLVAAEGGPVDLAWETRAGVARRRLTAQGWSPVEHRDPAPLEQVLPDGFGRSLPAADGALELTEGTTHLVAWTGGDGADGADADVWARFDAREALRVNSDRASARQDHAALASAGGHAIAVWEDDRHGATRLIARLVAEDGTFGPELTLATGPGTPRWPSVALARDGRRFAVAWKQGQPRDPTVMAGIWSVDGSPVAPPVALDAPGQQVQPLDPPAIVAQARGYAVLWCRRRGAPVLGRLGPDGALAAAPIALGPPGVECARPDLDRFSDGHLLAAWDARAPDGTGRIQVRRLGPDGAPAGEARTLPVPHGDAWDPSLATSPDGTALVAWCAGPLSDRSRDVVAQRLDARGRPRGALIPISVRIREQDYPEVARLASGDYVVAWEGDLSGHDHTYLRRVTAAGERGPAITLDPRDVPGPETRTRPLVVALGDGLFAAWSDRRRARHLDVFGRGLGPGFDAVRGR